MPQPKQAPVIVRAQADIRMADLAAGLKAAGLELHLHTDGPMIRRARPELLERDHLLAGLRTQDLLLHGNRWAETALERRLLEKVEELAGAVAELEEQINEHD